MVTTGRCRTFRWERLLPGSAGSSPHGGSLCTSWRASLLNSQRPFTAAVVRAGERTPASTGLPSRAVPKRFEMTWADRGWVGQVTVGEHWWVSQSHDRAHHEKDALLMQGCIDQMQNLF